MKIGFDLDGVVYNWHASLRHHVMQITGRPFSDFPDPERWIFHEDWNMSLEEFIAACDSGVDEGTIFQWGDPLGNAREIMTKISDAGNTIHVVTDRRAGSPGMAQASTVAWLKGNDLPFDSLTFSSDKTVVKTDFMIEDKLENYDALHFAGTKSYLINRPWNQQPNEWPYRRRVNSLDEFAKVVLDS